jgi:hypothetical protein
MYDLHAPAFINAMDAAPVPKFGTAFRPITPEQRRKRIMEQAEGLCAAEIAGHPWDVQLFADLLIASVMAVRAGAE